MPFIFSIAIGMGLIAGSMLAYFVARPLILRVSRNSPAPNLVRRFGEFTGLLALLPAGFIAFTAGGTLGGGLGELLLGQFGVPFGVPFGIAVVYAAILVPAALVGSLCGKLVALVLHRSHVA